MDNNKYFKLFETLGIPSSELPINYTPEEYAKTINDRCHFKDLIYSNIIIFFDKDSITTEPKG